MTLMWKCIVIPITCHEGSRGDADSRIHIFAATGLGRGVATVYEEQLETKFSRETENMFTLSLYYDVDGIGATPSSFQ